MQKKENQILNAVMSNIISKRDNVLIQLDLILNKNVFTDKTSDVVTQTTKLFKKLSTIESTLETVKSIIDRNENKFNEQISDITMALNKLQENNNLENHDNKS